MPVCEKCALEIPGDLMIKHIGNVHKYEPNFQIDCYKCEASYKKWTSFKKHYWLKHGCRIDPNENAGVENMDIDDEVHVNQQRAAGNADDDGIVGNGDLAAANREPVFDHNEPQRQPDEGMGQDENMPPKKKLCFQAAIFIATLKEKLLIPQSTVEKVIEAVSLFMEDYLELIKVSLLPPGEDVNVVSAERIQEVIMDSDPVEIFQFCKSSFHLENFMSENLHLVKPVKTCIGQKEIWNRAGDLVNQKFYAYTVPFLESLELCLNNDEILRCYENPLPYAEGVLKTITDGEYYRSLATVQLDPNALSVIIYFDVEYTNPLGSKTHKLATFYWTLGNIYPEYRSSILVHNLLAVTASQNLKDLGAEPLLRDFVRDMKELSSPEGVTLKIKGVDRVFHGCINVVAGDTPASGFLGGFKEGVGGALRPCRRCLIRKDEVKENFDVSSFVLRNLDSHLEQLNKMLLEGLTPQAKAFWSKQYGIKIRSCLLDINDDTDVTKCCPHDLMHIGNEGILAHHCLCFIRHCVEENVFALEDFNNALNNFDYDSFKKEKPSPVLQAHLQNGLKQSAAQMLALGQTLPFIIKEWVDESDSQEHLDLFILLMQIINLALAFELHEEDAALLSVMIRIHHTRFKFLYGEDAITPKWHYLLHLGEQVILFGPPRQHWCMRFEAVHSYYKNIARRNKNFKNLAYTPLLLVDKNYSVLTSRAFPAFIREDFCQKPTLLQEEKLLI